MQGLIIQDIILEIQTIKVKTPKHINKKFGMLTVIGYGKQRISKSGYRMRYLKCKCDCGKYTEVRSCSITSGKQQSCGCFKIKMKRKIKKSIIGKKFYNLTVIKRDFSKKYKNNRTVFYKCLCVCGKYVVCSYSNITTGKQHTCGNCHLYRNGVKTSWSALALNNMIPQGKHNYYTNIKLDSKHYINIDIALVEDKIAIEYDGNYWHSKNSKYSRIEIEEKKEKLLIDNGWKILRIKTDRNLPSQENLMSCIYKLKSNTTNKIILNI